MGEFPNRATQFSKTNQPPVEKKSRKNSRNIKSVLRDLLELPQDPDNPNSVNNLEWICAKLVNMAKEGDLASIDRIFDRTEGKPSQETVNKNVNLNRNVDVTKKELEEANKVLEQDV